MALLEILQAPHPLLKTKAQPVERVDDALRRLAADMFETMYKAPGHRPGRAAGRRLASGWS